MPTSKDLPRWIIFGVHRPQEVTRTSGVDVTRVVFLSLLSMTWMCGFVRVPYSRRLPFNEATRFWFVWSLTFRVEDQLGGSKRCWLLFISNSWHFVGKHLHIANSVCYLLQFCQLFLCFFSERRTDQPFFFFRIFGFLVLYLPKDFTNLKFQFVSVENLRDELEWWSVRLAAWYLRQN